MPQEISIADFQTQYEEDYISEVFSITVNNEKRIYGKTVKAQASNPKSHLVVYAVVP